MSRTVSMQFGKPGGTSQNGGGNGIVFDLLWSNPSPTSSFAAQNVAVDLSNYTWFAVKYRFQTGYPHDVPLAVYQVDEQNKYLQIANSNTNRTGGRLFNYSIANKSIHFDSASYNGSTSNTSVVPLEIYGISF